MNSVVQTDSSLLKVNSLLRMVMLRCRGKVPVLMGIKRAETRSAMLSAACSRQVQDFPDKHTWRVDSRHDKSTFSRRSIRWISTEGLRAVAATYLTFMSSCFISLLFMRPWVFACNHTCDIRVCTYSHSSQEVQDSHENLLSLKGPCGCVQGFLSPSVKTPLPVPSLWNDAIPQMADPQLEW